MERPFAWPILLMGESVTCGRTHAEPTTNFESTRKRSVRGRMDSNVWLIPLLAGGLAYPWQRLRFPQATPSERQKNFLQGMAGEARAWYFPCYMFTRKKNMGLGSP